MSLYTHNGIAKLLITQTVKQVARFRRLQLQPKQTQLRWQRIAAPWRASTISSSAGTPWRMGRARHMPRTLPWR